MVGGRAPVRALPPASAGALMSFSAPMSGWQEHKRYQSRVFIEFLDPDSKKLEVAPTGERFAHCVTD